MSIPHEVIVIDPKVSDFKTLVAGLGADIPVILLPESGDGLQLLADALVGYDDLSAIHLVSHGSAQGLLLGSGAVTNADLSLQQDALAIIAERLAPGADVLLYGCSVAADEPGRAFVDALSAALGADVAASTDRTGSIALDGDWDLEYATGEIESVLPFTLDGLNGLDHPLSSTSYYFSVSARVDTSTSYYGWIGSTGDHDWFRISLTAGAQYSFELKGYDTGHGSLRDPELSLRNSSGTVIATDDDSGTGLNSLISYTATSSGTYYLDAHENGDNATGSYMLTTAVTYVNHSPSGSPIITGSAIQGQTLHGYWGNITDADGMGTVSFRWFRNGVDTNVQTDYTLTQADVGKIITFTISYTDGYGAAENMSTATTTVANINDLPTGDVTISGNFTPGQTLTAINTLADLDGLGDITYYWYSTAGDTPTLLGSSAYPDYTLTNAEIGEEVIVGASYTDGFGAFETVWSNWHAVTHVNSNPTGSVVITGTATQGQTLTAVNTLADADGMGAITYQWKAGGSNIGTGSTYTLTDDEVGKTITVTASYTDGFGTLETKASSATSAVANVNDLPTGRVSVSSNAIQDRTLSTSYDITDIDGMLQAMEIFSWLRDGSVITGATQGTYTPTQADVGKVITFVISYIDDFGTAERLTASTSAVTNVNDAPTGSVTISGTATQGQTLTATNTLADADGVGAITYQWKAGGTSVGTGNTYTLTNGDIGKTITVTASYTDGFGTPETKTSNATSAVTNINDLPTGSVTISGTAAQGQTLTAANNLADADGMGAITYQWKAGGTNIGSGNTYTLTQVEVGKTITVTASYTDGFGTFETSTSSATNSVVSVNNSPTGSVTINGTAAQGQTLTATHTLTDADGMGAITYQWKAGGANIGTGNTYKLTAAEVGKTISVTASYTDGKGTAESVSSGATATIVQAATTAGFAITPGGTDTGEDGGSVSYRIALNTAPLPNQNVVITFTSSDTSEGVIAQPTLTFTTSNYATPQTLTVRGVDDYLDDGNVPYQITAKVSTTDVFYKTLTISPFSLTNTDDGLDTALDLYGDEGGSKVDVLAGGNGADKLHGVNMADNLSGGIGNDTLYGGYGDDNLFGEAGDDKLQGEQESDYMEGGAGNDTLDGGDGADTMIGGAGSDVYYLGYDATDVITDQGLPGDVDTVIMPYQLTRYTLPVGIENGAIAEGTQANSLTGNSGNNTLTGNAGNNGLNGGVGRDALFGDLGRDVLSGGVGGDTLAGGTGADRFDFNTPSETINTARDVISDFKAGEGDKIDLAGIDANTATAGNQAFILISSGVFSAAGQVRFDAVAHVLYGSNDADSAAEFAIQLNGVAGLTATAFIL